MSTGLSWLLVLMVIGLPVVIGVLVECRRREDERVAAFFAALRSEVTSGYDDERWDVGSRGCRMSATTSAVEMAQLAEWHATSYEIPVEVIWPDGTSLVTVTESVGCHTRADCWEHHAPSVAAREAAEQFASAEGLYVGRATMGHLVLGGEVRAGWQVYLGYAPLRESEDPEPVRQVCRQCGDDSGRCRHMGGRFGR